VTFASLLREVIDFAAKPETLVKGFQACGLYQLNANAVCITPNALVKIQDGAKYPPYFQ